MNSTRRKLAISTWSAPREGNIYGKLTADVSQCIRYVEHLRATTGEKVTIGHIVGKAVALALKQAPSLNGRVVFGRFVPFETVDVTFLVALDDGKDLAKTKVHRADERSIAEIAGEVGKGAMRLRKGEDEAFKKSQGLVRVLPSLLLRPLLWFTGFLTSALGIAAMGLEAFPFGSCILTNVGVFGLDEGYAPPTPFARVPIYILVGAVKDQPAAVDGQVVVRPMLTLTATIDHRFIDGAQLAVLARVVREGLAAPWTLDGQAEPSWAETGAA